MELVQVQDFHTHTLMTKKYCKYAAGDYPLLAKMNLRGFHECRGQ